MIEHLSMLLLLLLLLLLIFVWRIKEMVRSREESIGGKPAASQPLCVWVFVGHLRMYYKCGVRLFKHPAHDYLINCLTEFIFIKFFSSFVFFHRFYSLFVTFTLLFLRSNIWRRKKNYLYKHLAQSLIHPKIGFFIRSIMWESDFRWSRMPFCVYIIQFGCLHIPIFVWHTFFFGYRKLNAEKKQNGLLANIEKTIIS